MQKLKQIRDLFIAHSGNNFHPHLLRVPVMAGALLLVVSLQIIFHQVTAADGKVLGTATDITRQAVADITNKERQQNGTASLALNLQLQQAAQAKAQDMASRGYWSHIAPDGTAPWDLITEAGYDYEYAGENLARGFDTSQGVVAGWMDSPSHRANLLDASYYDVGIGVAEGEIEGERTTVVVALYGAVRDAASPLPVNPANSTPGVFASELTPVRYSLRDPLSPSATLTWVAKSTLTIMGLFAITYLTQHTVIRKRRLRWDKHAHSHPLLTGGLIIIAAVVMVGSSFGAVL